MRGCPRLCVLLFLASFSLYAAPCLCLSLNLLDASHDLGLVVEMAKRGIRGGGIGYKEVDSQAL